MPRKKANRQKHSRMEHLRSNGWAQIISPNKAKCRQPASQRPMRVLSKATDSTNDSTSVTDSPTQGSR